MWQKRFNLFFIFCVIYDIYVENYCFGDLICVSKKFA